MSNCPVCKKKFSFFDKITSADMCSDCFKELPVKYAPPSKKALEESRKPFSLKRLLVDVFLLVICIFYIAWMFSAHGYDDEKWFNYGSRSSPARMLTLLIFFIAFLLFDLLVNTLKLRNK